VRTIAGLNGAHGDVVVDGECWKAPNWSDWPLVVNSQNEGNVELDLPDGVAHRFEPREKIMLQTHYVNARTQKTPNVGKVLVNFDRIDKSAVTAELGTAFATNQNLRVCPGQSGVSFETTCRFAGDKPVTIFGANGHFHSRGRSFTMSVLDPLEGAGAPFYGSSWDEPLFAGNLETEVPARAASLSCGRGGVSDCINQGGSCCFPFGGGNVQAGARSSTAARVTRRPRQVLLTRGRYVLWQLFISLIRVHQSDAQRSSTSQVAKGASGRRVRRQVAFANTVI
jgi:hypothetical protein